jgi:two-component system sensor histidine kinase YesM
VNDDAFIMAANDNEGAPTTDVIKTYVIEETRNDETESVQKFGGWQMIKLDDSYYLFHLIKYGTIYLGAWVDTDKLLEPVVLSDTGPNNLTVFVDGEGSASNDADIIEENNINLKGSYENYYISGSQNKFLIVGEDSRQGNFSLVSLIRNDKMLENLPYLMQTSIILAILLIIILPISFLLLRKTVIFPLKKIVNTMQVIQKGNIDARINSYNTSREFHIVNKAFNDMMEQIKELKISVYEEKVNMQKAELKQLQMQINPHFFMNSLNVIHSLALTENYKLIQEMVQCLTSYFQYMAHINRPLVLLKDEIQHVDNYIRIQKMRFPDCLTYEIKASDFIMDILVPPQIIQLFVENTIKHALTTDKPIHLSVNIKMYDREDKPFLKIVINDTGKGFDEVVLEKLNADVLDINENDDHIGIWNIRNTLNLLYSDEAKISFSNLKPSGASVTIEFPAKTRNQQEGSD